MTAVRPEFPRVLVLMAAFNGAGVIQRQLDSILKQVGISVHIHVYDDASTDGTAAILQCMALRDDRITYSERSVGTGSGAQNFIAAIEQTGCEGFDFIALSDQDDVWEADKLRRAVTLLRSSSSMGYSSAVTASWPVGQRRILRQSQRRTRGDFLFEGAGQGCTYVLRAALYSRLSVFLRNHKPLTKDLSYHDWALYGLARSWEMPWIFDSVPSIQYMQHANNDIGARSHVTGLSRRLALLRSGKYRRQSASVACLCEAAAPGHPAVAQWRALESHSIPLARRLAKAWFCMRHGRRRRVDSVLTAAAALCGWV